MQRDLVLMKQSLKELIDALKVSDNHNLRYKYDTTRLIEEAKKGGNWTQWDKEVFEQYFEKGLNCIAKLGNGQMSTAEKMSVKEHWMELAPHLKTIADSQDVPLWSEYKTIRNIIRKYTNRNLNVATNRMLAGLQPKLLCTECDISRINKLVEYLRIYTDVSITNYDPVNWEKTSYALLSLLKSVQKGEHFWTFSHIPWMLLEECGNRFGKLPKKWLVFCNRNMWRHVDALHDKKFINWTMYRTNFSIGDIVYLFISDERRIRFMTRVTKDNCVREDNEYREYNNYKDVRYDTNHLTYKLELVAESMNEGLKEENLIHHGFKGGRSIQMPMNNNPVLFEYILSCFTLQTNDYDEIPNSETVFEGAKKEITVNRYERSQEAREKCIAAHGCKCTVCGMDFEKVYGEIGRGFIHVHHKVPLSSIGEEYELNPIKDLVPVCPNCHAMLHRKEPPYTIKELKEMLTIE